jgi:hypothetical protein
MGPQAAQAVLIKAAVVAGLEMVRTIKLAFLRLHPQAETAVQTLFLVVAVKAELRRLREVTVAPTVVARADWVVAMDLRVPLILGLAFVSL